MAFAVSASRAVVAAPAAAPQRSTARATTAAPKKALRLNSFTGMKVCLTSRRHSQSAFSLDEPPVALPILGFPGYAR
eukprot:scaffold4120_cov400-Prasinococcus_capsulatus_cf.AAC.12